MGNPKEGLQQHSAFGLLSGLGAIFDVLRLILVIGVRTGTMVDVQPRVRNNSAQSIRAGRSRSPARQRSIKARTKSGCSYARPMNTQGQWKTRHAAQVFVLSVSRLQFVLLTFPLPSERQGRLVGPMDRRRLAIDINVTGAISNPPFAGRVVWSTCITHSLVLPCHWSV